MTEAAVPEGRMTSLVYGYIRDAEYDEAAAILETQLEAFPRSRAALSLLGYCYYNLQQFSRAADIYDKLVRINPEAEEYRLYLAQSLFRAGILDGASRALSKLPTKGRCDHRANLLRASIHYERDDPAACENALQKCPPDDPSTVAARAALSFREGAYEEALDQYSDAFQVLGFQPDVAYGIALCHYKLGRHEDAMEVVLEIVQRGIEKYPQFSSSSSSHDPDHDEEDDIDDGSSIDRTALQESFLIEAYNLKAAIEFDQKNVEEAKLALEDMPRRNEKDLDPVSLHNQALLNMDTDANSGFKKLAFLLANPPFPPETFGNLLLLYCKHGYHHLAADILAENAHLTYDLLSQDLYDFLDASIMVTVSPDEALHKFEMLSKQHLDRLRKLARTVASFSSSKHTNNPPEDDETEEELANAKKQLQQVIDQYLPILMAHAKLYWDQGNYAAVVEKLFRNSAEFCSDRDAWKLNVAHAFFLQQGSKFQDAIKYYEPFVTQKSAETDSILDVAPIVLANLCVSYIMTNRNEAAEEIMKSIEKEEDTKLHYDPEHPPTYHSCIINLVIGTLYCEKGNFEFGISRICKSLEPLEKKLGPDTWFYTKRCFLALADGMAKQMLILKDDTFHDILEFLDDVEDRGKGISPKQQVEITANTSTDEEHSTIVNDGGVVNPDTISFEARQIKHIFIKLME